MRSEAKERYSALGLPSMREEAWKYTSLAPLARTRFRGPESLPPPPLASVGLSFLEGVDAVILSNGRLTSGNSQVHGVRVRPLKDALEEESLKGLLGSLAPWRTDAFAALNTAFLEDGIFVEIEKGAVVTQPIVLVYLSVQPNGSPSLSHPRTLIRASKGSEASLVEIHAGTPGGVYLSNSVTEVILEEGAVLDLARAQLESESAFHIERVSVRQERESRFFCHNFSFGAGLSRSDVSILLQGIGAECELNGLYLGDHDQHTDNETRIVHSAPRCTSRELYKGVLSGRAHGVFAGTILVEKQAQKTDAYQTNRNLLLSKEALVDSIPRLEILADDVKCKHGSATGQLDAEVLFYLRSRGIEERDARSMLILAFGRDIVQRVKVGPLKAELEAQLGSRLLNGGPES